VAGDTAAGAAGVAQRLRAEGYGSTIAYWDSGTEGPEPVAAEYERALCVAAATGGYVSVKATAVSFRLYLLERLADRGVRLHFDAMGPETVDETRALIERLPGECGTTLPGRWRRSDADAEWAIERGLTVRIVKGQWPGPDERDPSRGFLELVDRLAGRARSVSVATHDTALAHTALERLRARGTPCELEQLYGLRRAPAPARSRGRRSPARSRPALPAPSPARSSTAATARCAASCGWAPPTRRRHSPGCARCTRA